ncbi:hypothetical protein GW17_00015551 [Ensete ventricosum]|nr:hypothetical protein GW17_00015551 [Ensete ventricosum]
MWGQKADAIIIGPNGMRGFRWVRGERQKFPVVVDDRVGSRLSGGRSRLRRSLGSILVSPTTDGGARGGDRQLTTASPCFLCGAEDPHVGVVVGIADGKRRRRAMQPPVVITVVPMGLESVPNPKTTPQDYGRYMT